MTDKQMRTTSNGVSTSDVIAKTPTTLDAIPIRDELKDIEVLVLGLKQTMLTVGGQGGVDTGAGLGTDFIILTWGDRHAVVRGSELLRTWVATFAPDDAARFPEAP